MHERRLALAAAALLASWATAPVHAQALLQTEPGVWSPQTFFFSDTQSHCRPADPNCFSLAQMDFEMYRAPAVDSTNDEDAHCGPCVTGVPQPAPAHVAEADPVAPATAPAADNGDVSTTTEPAATPPVSGDKLRGAALASFDDPTLDEPQLWLTPAFDPPHDPAQAIIEQALHDAAIDDAIAVLDMAHAPSQTDGAPWTVPAETASAAAAVPEPPALSLAAIALIALFGARRARAVQPAS